MKNANFKSQAEMAKYLFAGGSATNQDGEIVVVINGNFKVGRSICILRDGAHQLSNFAQMQVEDK